MKTAPVFKQSVLGAIGATCLVAGTQFSAQALTFDGSAAGQFGNPVNSMPGNFNELSSQDGGTNNQFTWGEAVPDGINNFVKFNSANFSTAPDTEFKVGQLSYRNGTTIPGTSFNGDFPLSVALNFTNPAGVNPTFSYLFNILNTPNSTGTINGDADRLRFSTAGLSSSSFNLGGIDYSLQLLGFSSDNGATIITEFLSPEGETATSALYGKITTTSTTTTPVPTPALLPGLIGLGTAAWRQRRNAATVAA